MDNEQPGAAPNLARHLHQAITTLATAKQSLNQADASSSLNGVPVAQRASLRAALGRLDSVVAQLAGRLRLMSSSEAAVAQEAEAEAAHDVARLAAEVSTVARLIEEMRASAVPQPEADRPTD